MIAIECKAWAENIEHDRTERRGIAHFEVIICYVQEISFIFSADDRLRILFKFSDDIVVPRISRKNNIGNYICIQRK